MERSPVTVAEQSHGGEATEGGMKAQMEVTSQNGLLGCSPHAMPEMLHGDGTLSQGAASRLKCISYLLGEGN